jgi:hypothetical protein
MKNNDAVKERQTHFERRMENSLAIVTDSFFGRGFLPQATKESRFHSGVRQNDSVGSIAFESESFLSTW